MEGLPEVAAADMVTARDAMRAASVMYGRVDAMLPCRSTSVTASRDALPWKSSTARPRRKLCPTSPSAATPTAVRACADRARNTDSGPVDRGRTAAVRGPGYRQATRRARPPPGQCASLAGTPGSWRLFEQGQLVPPPAAASGRAGRSRGTRTRPNVGPWDWGAPLADLSAGCPWSITRKRLIDCLICA